MVQNALFGGEARKRSQDPRKGNEYWYMCDPWLLTAFRFCWQELWGISCPFARVHFKFWVTEKNQKYCLVWKIKKKPKLSYSPDEGEKIYRLSLPIFPFSHWPVQVVPSPQSIIFTAVTDGRTADCNYFYRYWGHLEAVSPHWKTEELGSHKGQVFITCSLTWIHRRTLTSNGMHRHKEKSYIFILARGKKVETTNSESVFRLELSLPISLRSLQTLDGEGRDDGAWRADGCARVNTLVHSPDGEGCSASKRKTCHDITGQCRCRAGTGSESQEAWWGRLCHAADRLWESGGNEGEVHLIAVLVGAHWLFEPLYINRPPSCRRWGITAKNSTQKIHFSCNI